MRLLGVHLPHPAREDLDRLLDEARQAALTYDYVGAMLEAGGSGGSRRGPRPSERRVQADLGRSDGTFERAVAALRAWLPQRAIGALVHPAAAPIEEGSTLLVVLRIGPFAVVAPTRVVAVVDQSGRFGFAYGTLSGHPVSGEEGFLVERSPEGMVTATIRVDARPQSLPARLAAPLVRRVQRWALARYLQAIEQHATQP